MDKKKVSCPKNKLWGGLFNKKRFEWMKEESDRYLKDLSIEKGVIMLEALTSQETLNEFKKEDIPHTPLCLKLGLKRRRDGFASGDI